MVRPGTVDAKAQSSKSGEAPGTSRPADGASKEATPCEETCAASWAALKALELDTKLLGRNRLVSHFGGSPAAPYDMLRTRILRQAAKNGWRRVAITSPDSGCGKSTIAANVGFSLQRQKDIRALVLDFDLRRAGLSRLLGQTPDTGVADLLAGQAEFAEVGRRHGKTVAFGLARPRAENPAELLQSTRMPEVLSALETTYRPDVVLFDLPPLMATDDAFAFLGNVDCALIVAAAERTSLGRIDVAERHAANLTSVMGVVLNRTRYASEGAHGYQYDYG